MKPWSFISVAVSVLALANAVRAQGTVNWSSINFSGITAQTNSTQFYNDGSSGGGAVGATAPSTSGLVYYFELLYNTSFTGSQIASPNYFGLFNGTWLDTGLGATNSQTAGRLAPVNPNSAAVVPWANGITNNIMLVGWSAALGTSWPSVSNLLANWNTFGSGSVFEPSYFGVSTTGYLNPGNGNPGVQVFGTSATTSGLPINSPDMQLFTMPITITPEPSTIALAGLSGLCLLLLLCSRPRTVK
jgi:hypothetical protein